MHHECAFSTGYDVEDNDDTDAYQFGFQKDVSTALCTCVFKSTVEYYRSE